MIHSRVPPGYRAVPLERAGPYQSWRLAVLIHQTVSETPQLVLLHNLPDARAYWGCLLDGNGMVRHWAEIWVQQLEGFAALGAGFQGEISSEALDSQWQRRWNSLREIAPHLILLDTIRDGGPIFVDPKACRVVTPTSPDGSPWVLCREDERLQRSGLPRYSKSTLRYLESSGTKTGSIRFVAADKHAPPSTAATSPSPELGFDPTWLPLNPQGGLMAARVRHLLNFGEYVDLLSGSTGSEVGSHKQNCETALTAELVTAAGHDGRRHGLLVSNNRGAEVLYLKLRLLLQATRSLMAHLRHTQCPLLNLDPGSFGVFQASIGDLPWPWGTTCELVRPGRAFSIPVLGTEGRRFIALDQSGDTAYCPGGLMKRGSLTVTVWIDRVISEGDSRAALEGRISTPVPVQVMVSDAVQFRLADEKIPDDFFGTVRVENAGLREEIPFRTWLRKLTTEQISHVKRFEGGKVVNCWCELEATLSSPYDLHSLGMLGARALLTHTKNPLSKVAGELERIGRQTSKELSPGATTDQIATVVQRLLAQDEGRLAVQNLFGELPEAAELAAGVPAGLWAKVITLLVRLIPGLGAVSLCADFGAAPCGGLHIPLEEPVANLQGLCAHARSLVFDDWNLNREVRAILAELRNTL